VIVTEAKAHSGSLITANLALQENRNVFAVPGAITSPLSAGTNQLISAGATPVIDKEIDL
jgi:DNA processing protein